MSRKNSRVVAEVFTRYFEKKFDERPIDASSSNSDSHDDSCDSEEDGHHEGFDHNNILKAFNHFVRQQSKVVTDSYTFHNSKKEKNVRSVYVTQLSDLSSKNAEALVAEEEKDRLKAEKKKVKKKKRKERKKEARENDNASSKTSRSGSLCNEDASSTLAKKAGDQRNSRQDVGISTHVKTDENDNIGADSSDGANEDEAFLDPNSAFVSKAVSKNKHKAVSSISKMEQACGVVNRKGGGSHDSVLAESEKLVRQGYDLASKERYVAAVTYFSKAIRLVNNDHRFYSNRSFCYCQLEQYNKALKDAEKAIELAPQNAKGYYRKAEAVRGLQQYKQAEMAYEKVLQLDEECDDARQDIQDVKVLQLMEMGFEESSSRLAIQHFQSVQAAIEELTLPNSPFHAAVEFAADEFYFSDDDTIQRMPASKTASGAKDIKMDPSNPEGLYSLWVGNISQSVKEKHILELFGKYGAVQNVRLLPEKFCAFVNFRNQKSPGLAMKSLQGKVFSGAKLLIRFPDTASTVGRSTVVSSSGQSRTSGPVNGDECYFWRTNGCAFGDKCRFKHLKESRGIDLKLWHKNK